MWMVLGLITFAGIVGGGITRLREIRDAVATYDPDKVKRLDRTAIAALPYCTGLAAAWSVPLFLSLTQSMLMEKAVDAQGAIDRFVLFGLCLVAAIASSRFLDTLTDRVLRVEERTDAAERKAESAEEKAEAASETAEQANAIAESESSSSETGTFATENDTTRLVDDEEALLSEFRKYRKWAPSMRGLLREMRSWDETRLRTALNGLIAKGLLHQLETTPNRQWVRWVISARGHGWTRRAASTGSESDTEESGSSSSLQE